MAPMTRAKSAKAGLEDPGNPKKTMESKLHINTRDDEGHRSASVRSEDTETTLQDTANAAAASSGGPPTPVLLESNGMRLRNGQPTEEDEQEVANFLVTEDFRNTWASDDVVVAAATIIEMKQDPNYDAPVQK